MKLKKLYVLLAALIIISGAFTLIIGGYEGGIYERNISAISDRYAELEVIMDANSEADTSEEKLVAIRINAVVVEYANAINALRADKRIATEDIVSEIDRLYLYGRISGECASVYERGRLLLDSTGEESLEKKYGECLEDVKNTSDITSLYKLEAVLVGKMNVTLYGERIRMLILESDGNEVLALANKARNDVEDIASGSLRERDYEEVYQKLKKDIAITRKRVWAERERGVFSDHLASFDYLSLDDRNALLQKGDLALEALVLELSDSEEKDFDAVCAKYQRAIDDLKGQAALLSISRAKLYYSDNSKEDQERFEGFLAGLEYLESAESVKLRVEGKSLLEKALLRVSEAKDAREAEDAYLIFIGELVKLREKCERSELEAAVSQLSAKAENISIGAERTIETLSYLSADEKLGYALEVSGELQDMIEDMSGETDIYGVERRYESFLEFVGDKENSARQRSLENAAKAALAELDGVYGRIDESTQSNESYAALTEIYEELCQKILESKDTEEIETILEEAKIRMTAVILGAVGENGGGKADSANEPHTEKKKSVLTGYIIFFGVLAIVESLAALALFILLRNKKGVPMLLSVLPVFSLAGFFGSVWRPLLLICLIVADIALGYYLYVGIKELVGIYRSQNSCLYLTEKKEEE